ncbi:hypothetical protein [Anaerotruncus rubiinfantis]|uniref:hypothetical protein n=1 Tax=Anaerotruncus rubiinfantis TaxID=1720200 RepID=UPI001899008F|nr:hypothetical protein [Anaerotruncus rubiinfantis]
MKKVLALVLALATVLSMSVVTFAASDYRVNEFADDAYTDKGVAITDLEAKLAPDQKIYFGFNDTINTFLNDEDAYKFKGDKGSDNSKMIESVKLVQKNLGGGAGRRWYVEVKVKDDMTDKEYKLSPEVVFTLKKDAEIGGEPYKDGEKFRFYTVLWIGNTTDTTDDSDETAGTGGKMIKPVKNEENTITWEDENDTLATLTFDADSDVAKYFPKLSTKWDNVKYAELFADQDAFVRQWVGTPSISSTSRAVLELNVPYIDEDDELTVDEDSIIVYEETADGELIDITDKGTFDWNEDDEYVFTMKTRKLGTYIFAEAPVTEADADDEVPADEVVDADKVNPGTGF